MPWTVLTSHTIILDNHNNDKQDNTITQVNTITQAKLKREKTFQKTKFNLTSVMDSVDKPHCCIATGN